MKMKDVTDLIKILYEYKLTEISWKEGEASLTLKKEIQAAVPAVTHSPAPRVEIPSSALNSAKPEVTPETPRSDLHDIKSPMVGTFYSMPSPDDPPYVKVGDHIVKGQVICIIEAMKLMNEIESETDGIVEKVCVSNSSPVEFDTVLFQIRKG